MSGPIIRSGPTPEYSDNWDDVFGGKAKKSTAQKKTASKATKKKTSKAKTPKKATKKKAKS